MKHLKTSLAGVAFALSVPFASGGDLCPAGYYTAILIMTEAAALALVGELVFLQPAPFASCPENYFYRLLDSSSPFRYFSVSGPTTSHSGAAGPP